MNLLTWNIQAGRGSDGAVDLARIARVLRALGDAHVICLQEVARHVPAGDGSDSGDQVAALAALFPGYTACFGAAVDRAGERGTRQQFGNLVLSRVPVLQCFRHALPQPADSTTRHMPRQATEVMVAAPGGALRIVTTHLEFHSHRQRMAQVRRLREIDAEVRGAQRRPAAFAPVGLYAAVPRPASSVLCGDFNVEPGAPEYRRLTAPGRGAALSDAWTVARPGQPHPPTCGVHDHAQWPQGAHCRDYFFCSRDVAARIEAFEFDAHTNASDHQPLLLRVRAPAAAART
jgi:endonuclease/exonuclease/phosphatase family metal-dependent hydrolase